MKVVATKQGYFGKLRQPGDEFEVPKGEKASWFSEVKADQPAKSKADQPESGKDLV